MNPLKFFKRKKCTHEHLRCIHGDEIMTTAVKSFGRVRFARVQCLTCGKPLYDTEMLDICTETSKPHHLARKKNRDAAHTNQRSRAIEDAKGD